MEMKQALHFKTELQKEIIPIGEYKFIGKFLEGVNPDAIRKISGELRQELPDLLLVLATVLEGKPTVTIAIGDQMVREKNLDASRIIKEIVAPLIKGGGGGQKTIATAGGQDASTLESVVSAVKALIADR